jgi:hypothetical protein
MASRIGSEFMTAEADAAVVATVRWSRHAATDGRPLNALREDP